MSLKMSSDNLSSEIFSQRQHFIQLRKEISMASHGRSKDKILDKIVRPDVRELSDQIFCRQEFKDNFIIVFTGEKYKMATADGAIPFHKKDFYDRLLEEGKVELRDKSIILRNLKNKELKQVFIIKEKGIRALYAYGDLMMPKRYCNELQLHLYEILKEME